MDDLTPSISLTDMTKLVTADQAYKVAKSAATYHELQCIAALINNAANTGETQVVYNRPLSKYVLDMLKSNNYKVVIIKEYGDTNIQISWESNI